MNARSSNKKTTWWHPLTTSMTAPTKGTIKVEIITMDGRTIQTRIGRTTIIGKAEIIREIRGGIITTTGSKINHTEHLTWGKTKDHRTISSKPLNLLILLYLLMKIYYKLLRKDNWPWKIPSWTVLTPVWMVSPLLCKLLWHNLVQHKIPVTNLQAPLESPLNHYPIQRESGGTTLWGPEPHCRRGIMRNQAHQNTPQLKRW